MFYRFSFIILCVGASCPRYAKSGICKSELNKQAIVSLLDQAPQYMIEKASDEEFSAYLAELDKLTDFVHGIPNKGQKLTSLQGRDPLSLYNGADFWNSRFNSHPSKALSDIELLLLSDEPGLLTQYKSMLKLSRAARFLKNDATLKELAQPFVFLQKLNEAGPHRNALKDTQKKLEAQKAPSIARRLLENPAYWGLYRMGALGTLKTTGSLLLSLGKILTPLPTFISLPAIIGHRKIAMRQYHDPQLKFENLNPLEKDYLIKNHLKDAFEVRGKFLQENPAKAALANNLVRAYKATLALSSMAAASILTNQDDDDYVSFDDLKKDYLTDNGKKYAPANNEVQVLVNLAPFPHLAMRIHDRVFTYGVQRVDILPWAEYYLPPEAKNNATPTEPTLKAKKDPTSSTKALSSLYSALKPIDPAGMQIATLTLTESEVNALEKDLLDQHAKYYKNITQVNDCATMALRALRAHSTFDESFTRLIDSSPSQVLMYFSALKATGDPRVKSITTVMQEKEDRVALHKARNFIINNAESKLFLTPLPFLYAQGQRLLFDAENATKEDTQYRSKYDLKIIDELSEELASDYLNLDNEGKLSLYAGAYRYSNEKSEEASAMALFHKRGTEILNEYSLILPKLPALKRKVIELQLQNLRLTMQNLSRLRASPQTIKSQ